jgi:uncharacterized repeat protein (TIGR02543 family)
MRKKLFVTTLAAISLLSLFSCSLEDVDALRASTRATVSFRANGGTPAPAKQNVGKGRKLSQPAAMSKTGYVFEGWFKEEACDNRWDFASDTVKKNITLYAKWNPITYTVRYDKNAQDAVGATADSEHVYDTAKPLTSSGFTRAGYGFAGWNENADGSGESYDNGQSVLNLSETDGAVIDEWSEIASVLART